MHTNGMLRHPKRRCAAFIATTSTGTASLKLGSDPLGSQFLNDSADEPFEPLTGQGGGGGTSWHMVPWPSVLGTQAWPNPSPRPGQSPLLAQGSLE